MLMKVLFFQEIARHLRPRTLRALFGKDKIRNAVHCTDLPEDGILEVCLLVHESGGINLLGLKQFKPHNVTFTSFHFLICVTQLSSLISVLLCSQNHYTNSRGWFILSTYVQVA